MIDHQMWIDCYSTYSMFYALDPLILELNSEHNVLFRVRDRWEQQKNQRGLSCLCSERPGRGAVPCLYIQVWPHLLLFPGALPGGYRLVWRAPPFCCLTWQPIRHATHKSAVDLLPRGWMDRPAGGLLG